MTDTKSKTTKSAADKAAKTVETKTQAVAGAASAISASANAYVTGVTALTKVVFGIGKEVAGETVEHGKASMQANCVRSLAEMQASYAQHRIESSTVHVKEVADVATESLQNVYAPLIGLLKDRKAA